MRHENNMATMFRLCTLEWAKRATNGWNSGRRHGPSPVGSWETAMTVRGGASKRFATSTAMIQANAVMQ